MYLKLTILYTLPFCILLNAFAVKIKNTHKERRPVEILNLRKAYIKFVYEFLVILHIINLLTGRTAFKNKF